MFVIMDNIMKHPVLYIINQLSIARNMFYMHESYHVQIPAVMTLFYIKIRLMHFMLTTLYSLYLLLSNFDDCYITYSTLLFNLMFKSGHVFC
jgi:hypothetical protein